MAYTTIKKPSDYFNTKLYTGNGSTQSITGIGFQPDWTWTKNRDDTYSHWLFDSVRGVNKGLRTDRTDAEIDNATRQVSFDSDGFTLGNSADVNVNGNNYASWNWLASNTTASNTDGSITSTVSANTTSGFSIVSYTGTGSNATVGHGLGVVPKMIIVKQRSGAGDWTVYNSNIGNTNFLRLNGTLASTPQSTYWNNTTPTSSVFSVGSAGDVNTSSGTHIAYCFAEKKGFSKFGSYTGNGNADGTFVYTGFKPAFVILKITNSTNNWHMYDNKRDTYNVADAVLYPNTSGAEGTDTTADFLSNGFKLRTSINFANGSGDSYIYMAFAEEPLVGDNPATAR
jgi:hypothetical protein